MMMPLSIMAMTMAMALSRAGHSSGGPYVQTPGPLTVYCNPKAVPAQLCPPITPAGPGIACPECGTTQCPCPGTTKFICDKNSQTCTANSIGNYSDLGNCLNACKPSPAPAPEVRYTCNATDPTYNITRSCVPTSAGRYNNRTDCEKNCPPNNCPPPPGGLSCPTTCGNPGTGCCLLCHRTTGYCGCCNGQYVSNGCTF